MKHPALTAATVTLRKRRRPRPRISGPIAPAARNWDQTTPEPHRKTESPLHSRHANGERGKAAFERHPGGTTEIANKDRKFIRAIRIKGICLPRMSSNRV